MSWLLRELSTGPKSDPKPEISVCIPSLDGGDRLVDAVAALLGEETSCNFEILVADSGSKDGSFERLRAEYPTVRGFAVAPRRFNHGLVRNELARIARAPLVSFLSQDAVPAPGFLAVLTEAFVDPTVAGAYARQTPRPDDDPLLCASLERWTPAGDVVVQQELAGRSWESLSPEEKMRCARFDNVASMLRRSLLLASPFQEVEFGEDILWGAEMVQAGHRLVYVPQASVEHSHTPRLIDTLLRHRAAHHQASRDFGLNAVPSLASLGQALFTGLPGDLRDGGLGWALRGLPRRAAALAGQWLGGRDASK